MAAFTKQQLFQVRNEIDIDYLISDKLNLERQFNGMWRFRCPLCQQFNTAKINFVPAVQWLLSLVDNKSSPGQVNQNTKIESRTLPDKKLRTVNRIKGRQEIEKIKRMIQ